MGQHLRKQFVADLNGLRCLITGGSRNLGRTLCLAFANANAKVAFTYSAGVADAQETQQLLEKTGAPSLMFRGSVDDAAHVRETVATLKDAWGGVDVLINNAAAASPFPMALLDEADWDRVMR